MPTALVVYGSTTGSTEILASYIADAMQEQAIDVTIGDVIDTDVEDLRNYDIIVLGSSTWDGGLQDDFIAFEDDMNGMSLRRKQAAVFGVGKSSHGKFCEAVDTLEKRLRMCGAEVIVPSLKIDGDVMEAEDKAKDWARRMAGVVRI